MTTVANKNLMFHTITSLLALLENPLHNDRTTSSKIPGPDPVRSADPYSISLSAFATLLVKNREIVVVTVKPPSAVHPSPLELVVCSHERALHYPEGDATKPPAPGNSTQGLTVISPLPSSIDPSTLLHYIRETW
jgi:hypothetical protein